VGDFDLDAMARGFTFSLLGIQIEFAHFTFNPQLEIRGAGFVTSKAVFEGMGEVVQSKMFAAAGIGAIEERAMVSACRHAVLRLGGRGPDLYRPIELRGVNSVRGSGVIGRDDFYSGWARETERILSDGELAGGDFGELSGLEADGDEQVPQTVQRLTMKEIGGEIDGKGRGEFLELAQKGGFVQTGDHLNQFFDLIVG
jgi:hypothetical protein